MNSTPFNDKQSEELLNTCVESTISQNFSEKLETINTNSKSPTSTSFDKPRKLNNETKEERIAETDDSFDIFVPLKVKNYKNGLKKPNNASSTNKYKKKKVTSSNRICPYFSTRKSPTSSKEDRDLKLAIERSLEDISPSKSSGDVLSDIVNENKPSYIVPEKKPIKYTSNFLKSLTNKTKKAGTNTLLFRRSGEERQEIIIKKIGILLLEKENIFDECLEKLEINLISSNLEELWDKNSTLWELSKIEVNDLSEFYVSTLEKFIDRPPVDIEQPVTAMSEADSIVENDNVEADVMNNKTKVDKVQSEDNHEIEITEIKQEKNSDCDSIDDVDFNTFNFEKTDSMVIKQEKESESNGIGDVDFNNFNFSTKDKFLTDSLNIFSDDLFSLYGSFELSDFNVILKTGESLPCHELILQARCPNLLSNVMSSDETNSLDFSQFSSQATRAFFKFIYSGKLDFIYSLSCEEKSDLYVLAKRYRLEFLENFLLRSFSPESFHVYSQSTCSPPESPSRDAPDSSQAPKESIADKDERFSLLAHESFEKDKEKLSILKENKDVVLSFANLAGSINNSASTSSYNSFQNNSTKSFPSVANESYDIFKDDIKSPCNSSLISSGFQSKRKLDYPDVLNETKKICSENIPIRQENIPEVVMLDSDSSEEFTPKSSSQSSHDFPINVLDSNEESMNEEGFKSSSSSSQGYNITDCFGRFKEVRNEPTEISPIKSYFFENRKLIPVRSSPQLTRAFPTNKDRSIDKYFEASFPDEVNENIDVIEKFSQQAGPASPRMNINLSKQVLTPLQGLIIDKASPKPDFDNILSPQLKAELRKYGLKENLDVNRARVLLQYIFEQIHPVKTDLPSHVREPHPSTSKARSPSPVFVIDDDSNSSDRRENNEKDFAYEEYLFNQSKVKNEFSTNEMCQLPC
nr:uncharacterized protein LOC106691077 isoform X2 [Halyomorpha halys]